jgi:ABC-type amino acid transport system permease subunit
VRNAPLLLAVFFVFIVMLNLPALSEAEGFQHLSRMRDPDIRQDGFYLQEGRSLEANKDRF